MTSTQGKTYITIDRNLIQDYHPLIITMTHTIQEQGNEGWTVNKKKRQGEEEEGEQTDTEKIFQKFGINLGSFRMEAEILVELHLKYPCVNIVRRITRTGNALLVPKEERSRKLLTEVKDLNRKELSFRPMYTIFRKTYILMGVPSCIKEERLPQDDMVLEDTPMTKWNDTKLANHTEMVKVVLTGKEQSARFTRSTATMPVQTCIYCTGSPHSHPCNDNKQRTLKCANCGQEHATTSRLCPKRMEAEKKSKTSPASPRTTHKQDSTKPTPIPSANSWATLTVQEVEKRPFSCKPSIPITTPATIVQTMEVSTKQSKPTARNSI